MSSICACQALTQLVGITFASLITCSAIFFPLALFICTKKIVGLRPSFDLTAFERKQLYEIWSYLGSFIINPSLYNSAYSLPNSSCYNMHLNIDSTIHGVSRPPFLLMRSISSSQSLISAYEVSSCLGAITISLPFKTQWISQWCTWYLATLGGHLSPICPHTPKSVASRLLPCHSFWHASNTSHAHRFTNISTHCRKLHSSLSKWSNTSLFWNVDKKSTTAVSQCRVRLDDVSNGSLPR